MGNKLSYPAVDLSGKVAVVTGANTGIGYEIAKALAEMGAHTIIACRSQERAAAALHQMMQEVSSELKLGCLIVDLASFSSVKEFVKMFKEKNLPLHILINNAALCGVPYQRTEDGIELQVQVNHLSPQLLTLSLLPCLQEAARIDGDARIVFVSCAQHMDGVWCSELFNSSEDKYQRLETYKNTKLYNVMTASALQRRLQDTSITISSVEPGNIKTEIGRGFADLKIHTIINDVGNAFANTPKEGAATVINCAVNPDLRLPHSQAAIHYADYKHKTPSATSQVKQFQEELWKTSIDYLKDHLPVEIVEKYGVSQMLTVTPDKPPTRKEEDLPSDKEQQRMRNKDSREEEDETKIKLMSKSVTFKDEKKSESLEELVDSRPQIENAQELQSERKPDVCDTDWQVADLMSNDQSEVKPTAVTARHQETQQLSVDELQAHMEEMQSAEICQQENNSLLIKVEEETKEVPQQVVEIQPEVTIQEGTLPEARQQKETLRDEALLSKVSQQENNVVHLEAIQNERAEPEEQQCEEMPLDVIQHEETQLSMVQLQEVQTVVPQPEETQTDDNWVLKSKPDKLEEINEFKEPEEPDVLQKDDAQAEQHKTIWPDDVWQDEIVSKRGQKLVIEDQQGETQILKSQQEVVQSEEHEMGNIQPVELEEARTDTLQEKDVQAEAEDLKQVWTVEVQEDEQQMQPEIDVQLKQAQPEELQEHETWSDTSQQEMTQEEREKLENVKQEVNDIHHADRHLEEAELEETQSDETRQQDACPEEPKDEQIDEWQQEPVGSIEKKLVVTHADHLLQEDEPEELKQDVVQKESKQAEAEDTEDPQEEVTQQDGLKQIDIQPENGKTQSYNIMLQEQDLVHVPSEELESGETRPYEPQQKEVWSEYLDQRQMQLAMEEPKQGDIKLEDSGKQLDEQHHEKYVQKSEELNLNLETRVEVQSTEPKSEDRDQHGVVQEAEVKLDGEETKLCELEVLAEATQEEKEITEADEPDVVQSKSTEQDDAEQKVLLSEEQEKL